LEILKQPAIQFAIWFAVFYLYNGLGITLGYHRLLTHKSVKIPRWLAYFIVSGGYFCLMGSPIVWVGVHRLHHQKSDLPGDPHSPRDGFKHALFEWMFDMRSVQSDEELQAQVPDLMKDKFYRWLGCTHDAGQAQMCLYLNIAFRLVVCVFLGWPAMLASIAATFIVFWSTQLVNAVCHLPTAGYRLYETREDSRNVWWVALLSLGEGWHNAHHAMPKSARHGTLWYELDVTWISIWLLNKIGLAENIIYPHLSPVRQPAIALQPVTPAAMIKPTHTASLTAVAQPIAEIHPEQVLEPALAEKS
jgi:stearoyl-CoA desaturase (delta-9 desaturase)